ncbi:hypothetical protein MJO29_013118 [Puccinia striiformis f. sp. tritici]|nr:hypothetical protein MJO29_013118 [Puccinia striiformis f. sp. tritici]
MYFNSSRRNSRNDAINHHHPTLPLIILHATKLQPPHLHRALKLLKMTRLSKVKPLVQVTAKQKKKQEKISVRYSRSRAFLTGLMQGNYQLPPITNEPDQPSDQIAHHEQTHYFGEDNNPDDSQTAGPLSIDDLSAWGSIPWNEAATSNIPKPTLSSYLDPEVSATIREHDRNVAHHRRENNWRQMMSKLFVSYLWLKEKTQNWTSPCSFDSFVSKLCKCSKDAPCSDHWIDLVDINGNYLCLSRYKNNIQT